MPSLRRAERNAFSPLASGTRRIMPPPAQQCSGVEERGSINAKKEPYRPNDLPAVCCRGEERGGGSTVGSVGWWNSCAIGEPESARWSAAPCRDAPLGDLEKRRTIALKLRGIGHMFAEAKLWAHRCANKALDAARGG